MNERIRLLALQSDATVLGTISGGKQYTFLEQDLARFAELIVQECVGVVNVWSDEQPCSEGYDILTVSKIKQHFGVE